MNLEAQHCTEWFLENLNRVTRLTGVILGPERQLVVNYERAQQGQYSLSQDGCAIWEDK